MSKKENPAETKAQDSGDDAVTKEVEQAEANEETQEAVAKEAAKDEAEAVVADEPKSPAVKTKAPKSAKAQEVELPTLMDDTSESFPLSRRIAHVLRTRSDTQQWITLADTKGGLLLTANGVIAGFMTSQFSKLFKAWPSQASAYLYGIVLLFVLYGAYQLMSFLYTMWIILPRPMSMSQDHLKRTRHVFNYSLTLNFPTLADGPKLAEEYNEITEEELLEEHVLQLHIDSIVCTRKYTAFMKAFKALQFALVFGALAFAGSVPITHKSTAKTKVQQTHKTAPKAAKTQRTLPAPNAPRK